MNETEKLIGGAQLDKKYISKRMSDFRQDKKLSAVESFPKSIMIELSNSCNHACPFCANRKMTRRKSFIKKALLNNIIHDAYELGAREVGFYTTGEPFMHKGLVDFVRSAKDIGYSYTYITTNGALADRQTFRSLVQAGIDSIKFSINAGNKDMYKSIHGHDDWDRVIDNLKYLSDLRKTIGRPLALTTGYVVTSDNKNAVKSFRKEMEEYVDEVFYHVSGRQAGYMPENINVEPDSVPEPVHNFRVTLPCIMIFKRAHVTCEGYLTLCCADYQNYLAVADLNEMSLKDAWNCELFVDMRKKHLSGNVDNTLCYNCVNNINVDIKPLCEKLHTPFDFTRY